MKSIFQRVCWKEKRHWQSRPRNNLINYTTFGVNSRSKLPMTKAYFLVYKNQQWITFVIVQNSDRHGSFESLRVSRIITRLWKWWAVQDHMAWSKKLWISIPTRLWLWNVSIKCGALSSPYIMTKFTISLSILLHFSVYYLNYQVQIEGESKDLFQWSPVRSLSHETSLWSSAYCQGIDFTLISLPLIIWSFPSYQHSFSFTVCIWRYIRCTRKWSSYT